RGDAAATAGRRHRLAVYLLLATAFISFQRYDIFAAIPAFLGVRAAERGRWRAAWTWSLLGVWLKLYPVVFWPLWLVAEWRERGRWRWDRLAAGAALAIMPTVAVTLSGTGGHWVGFLVNRPANLGSVPGDLAAVLTGNYRYRMTYGAYVVNAVLAGPLSLLADGLGMAVMAVVLARVARGRMSLRAGGVMVLWTLILSSKVFSPQYLIWVAPLMADFDLDWRWLLGAFWTTLAFPLAYLAPSGSWILVHRADWYFIQDIFLVWGLAVFFRRETRSAVAGEMGGRWA
nr:hypothetical protein [Thermaerobacter sp.]